MAPFRASVAAVGRALLCLALALPELSLPVAQGTENLIVQAAGASFPNLVYQDLIFAYQFVAPNVKMSYVSTGSGGGTCRMKDFAKTCNAAGNDARAENFIDWAGSDSLLNEQEYAAYPDLQMLPTLAGAMVPVYNIPMLQQADNEVLVVDRTTLAYIFMGNITRWNDHRILALQDAAVRAKIENEDKLIEIVVRDDKSGSTEVFTKTLNMFSAGEFAKYVGSPSSEKSVWHQAKNDLKIQYQPQAEGVAAGVLLTPWSIGYSSIGEAKLNKLPIPKFRQNDRQQAPVAATIASISHAMLEKGLQFGNNGDDPARLTADIMDASGDEAWPMATFTYVVLRNGLEPTNDRIREGATCANVKATLEFWNWFYTSEVADNVARQQYFVPLPEHISFPPYPSKQTVLEKLRSMKCGGDLALKNAVEKEKKVVAAGIVDSLVRRTLSLYTSVYKSVDPMSDVTLLEKPSADIDLSKRLASNEAFKVVLGDAVYDEPWVAEDRSFVLKNGQPVKGKWSELYPVEGRDASMVFPFFSFAIHFVVNIVNQPTDKELVLTPNSIRKILNGMATTWTDPDIIADNDWISTISPKPGIIKWIVNRDKDIIYEILKSKLSDGFASYDLPSTVRLSFYEHQTAIITGTPDSITYGPFVPGYPQSVRFAALKWTDAPEAVLPSYTALHECTKAPNSFDLITRQYTPRSSFKGCYPLTITANVIFHHAFASSEKYCFVNDASGDKGTGAVAVQFWKWMFESGPRVEEAIVRQFAVPLVHTANNTDQVKAVSFVSDTIHCAHPPDPVVVSMRWHGTTPGIMEIVPSRVSECSTFKPVSDQLIDNHHRHLVAVQPLDSLGLVARGLEDIAELRVCRTLGACTKGSALLPALYAPFDPGTGVSSSIFQLECPLGADTVALEVSLVRFAAVPALRAIIRCGRCRAGEIKTEDSTSGTWFCRVCVGKEYVVDPNNVAHSCQACPVGGTCCNGTFTPLPGSEWERDDATGVFRIASCAAGSFIVTAPYLDQSCLPCTAGYYCSGGAAPATKCPPRTLSEPKASSKEACWKADFVSLTVNLPLLESVFDNIKQAGFKQAIASSAGVNVSYVEIISLAQTSARRQKPRALALDVEIVVGSTEGTARNIVNKLQQDTINQNLQLNGLPPGKVTKSPTVIRDEGIPLRSELTIGLIVAGVVVGAAMVGVYTLFKFSIKPRSDEEAEQFEQDCNRLRKRLKLTKQDGYILSSENNMWASSKSVVIPKAQMDSLVRLSRLEPFDTHVFDAFCVVLADNEHSSSRQESRSRTSPVTGAELVLQDFRDADRNGHAAVARRQVAGYRFGSEMDLDNRKSIQLWLLKEWLLEFSSAVLAQLSVKIDSEELPQSNFSFTLKCKRGSPQSLYAYFVKHVLAVRIWRDDSCALFKELKRPVQVFMNQLAGECHERVREMTLDKDGQELINFFWLSHSGELHARQNGVQLGSAHYMQAYSGLDIAQGMDVRQDDDCVQAIRVHRDDVVEAKLERNTPALRYPMASVGMQVEADETVFIMQLHRRAKLLDKLFKYAVIKSLTHTHESLVEPHATIPQRGVKDFDGDDRLKAHDRARSDQCSGPVTISTPAHILFQADEIASGQVGVNACVSRAPDVEMGQVERERYAFSDLQEMQDNLDATTHWICSDPCCNPSAPHSGDEVPSPSRVRKLRLAGPESCPVSGVVNLIVGFFSDGPGWVQVHLARIKTQERMRAKLDDYLPPHPRSKWPLSANITDPIRLAIVCYGAKQVLQVVRWFVREQARTGLKVCRIKNRFLLRESEVPDGYRDIALNVIFQDPATGLKVVGEIQVHDKMLHGLMMKMHKLYRLKRASTPDLVT